MIAEPEDPTPRIVEAALALAAEDGWRAVAMADIARAAGIGDDELRRRFRSKMSILLAHARQIEDEAASLGAPFDAEDTPRDRLFELLMQRIDLLRPRRAAVASAIRDLPLDPLGLLAILPGVANLMAAILAAAGEPARGPVGAVRCKGLALIWLATLRVWAEDESPDNARTMAALDGYLRRIEPWAARLGHF